MTLSMALVLPLSHSEDLGLELQIGSADTVHRPVPSTRALVKLAKGVRSVTWLGLGSVRPPPPSPWSVPRP